MKNAVSPSHRYQDIIHSIHLTRKGKLGLRTCDGYAELLKYLRSDIQEVASRLQKGGLGYLDDNVDIEEQVSVCSLSAEDRRNRCCFHHAGISV